MIQNPTDSYFLLFRPRTWASEDWQKRAMKVVRSRFAFGTAELNALCRTVGQCRTPRAQQESIRAIKRASQAQTLES